MPEFPVTLALTTGEIVAIVMAILTIGGGLLGSANEAKKTKERREAKKRGDRPARSEAVTDVDSLAQRRREQLEAMAARRRGPSVARPDNMTTNQVAEREAAKAAYAERAASMREQGAVNPMLAQGAAGGRAQADADAERATVRNRQANRSRVEAQERARRKQEARLAQQQARQARPQTRRPPPVPVIEEEYEGGPPRHLEQLGTDVSGRKVALADLGKGAREVDTSVHDGAYETDEVHRHVTDVTEAGTAVPARASRIVGLMAGRSWRDVFLLKEMLDPPVSMRKEQGPSDPFSV